MLFMFAGMDFVLITYNSIITAVKTGEMDIGRKQLDLAAQGWRRNTLVG